MKQKLEVAPGLICYRDPLGSRFVNFYALEDAGGYALFDTALPGVVTAWLDEKELEANIQQAIISHSDADHFGDTAALKERFPEMQVLCHPADRRWIEDH
ncbi:MAG: MBL fold metallo-hydrolase, partial [Chloroflexi bacterium]|nr:MBL fold metallo-hydrolase [Chloroflexota bacterium]